MTGRPALSRGALPWLHASLGALCLVVTLAIATSAASTPGPAIPETARQPSTPDAMATPAATPEADWSNGAELIWTYQTGTDYWAGNFPSIGGGVFGVYTSDSDTNRVFDAETFELLWSWDKGSGRYSWRPTTEAFFIKQGGQLTARDPRRGTIMWSYTALDEEWDWTTYDGGGGDRPRRYVYITSDNHFAVIDIATGEPKVEAQRTGDHIDWTTEGDTITIENGRILMVVNLNSGRTRWSVTGEGTSINRSVVDDEWYVTSGGTLAVIDPSTGEERWRFAGSGESISWRTEEDILYVRSGRDISALDPNDGTEQWRYTAIADVESFRATEDQILVRSGASVSAIDPELGVERWRFSQPDTVSWGSIADNDALYVYGGSVLSMLDAETGAETWRFPTESSIDQVEIDDEAFVIVAETALISVDVATGAERWRYTATGQVDSLSVYDERITFIANDTLFAVDPSTGGELWRSEVMPGVLFANFDDESDTFEVSIDGAGAALIDARTGETLLQGWSEERDDVIYTRNGGQVTAFDVKSRGELWRYSSDSSVSRFYLRDTMVLVVTRNLLVALDRATGTELWTFVAQAPIESLDMDDDIIRLTDSYGTLYALAPKPIQLEAGGEAMTTSNITLRGAPNATSVERATIPAGIVVTITGESEEHDGVTWWPVTTGEIGEQGWVPTESLEPVRNASSAPATPPA